MRPALAIFFTALSMLCMPILGQEIQSNNGSEETTSYHVSYQWELITEFAGMEMADGMARNWSRSADLIEIYISETKTHQASNLEPVLATTGWGYIYRSNDKYIDILINLSDLKNNTGRIEELDGSDIWVFKYKRSLPSERDWKITSYDAINIASYESKMSIERGDFLATLYLEMDNPDGTLKPIWHVSIQNGVSGVEKDYAINAMNGEIIG